jgi:hypothetical protein
MHGCCLKTTDVHPTTNYLLQPLNSQPEILLHCFNLNHFNSVLKISFITFIFLTYLAMKFGLSHSYYVIFEPDFPIMYTDDVKYCYKIYIIISLLPCIPDYDAMLSRNYIKLSIVQKISDRLLLHIVCISITTGTPIQEYRPMIIQLLSKLPAWPGNRLPIPSSKELNFCSCPVCSKNPVNTLQFNLIFDSHLYYFPIYYDLFIGFAS